MSVSNLVPFSLVSYLLALLDKAYHLIAAHLRVVR